MEDSSDAVNEWTCKMASYNVPCAIAKLTENGGGKRTCRVRTRLHEQNKAKNKPVPPQDSALQGEQQ
eukprot:14303923-Ditylum_brightwellii.AAC.1